MLKTLLSFCLCGAMVSPCLSAFALDFPAYGTVIEDKVNVRLDSTTGAPVLGTVNIGQVLRLNQEKYSWYKVTLPSQFSCFVSSQYLRRSEGKKAVITASSLNMRQNPAQNSPIIGKIPGGATVRIIRGHQEWTEISCFPYAYGWVHNKFIVPLTAQETAQLPDHLREMPVAFAEPAPLAVEPEPVPVPVPIAVEEAPGKKIEPVTETAALYPPDRTPPAAAQKDELKQAVKIPATPPLAKGTLARIKHKSFGCPADYMLESNTGFILLKIKGSEDPEKFINREVSIWGKVKNSSCVYIEVNRIIPR